MEEGKEVAKEVAVEQNPEVETLALLTQFEPKFIRFVKGEMPEGFKDEYLQITIKVAELIRFEKEKVDKSRQVNPEDPEFEEKVLSSEEKNELVEEMRHDLGGVLYHFYSGIDFLTQKKFLERGMTEEIVRKRLSEFSIKHLIRIFKSSINEIDGKQIISGKTEIVDLVQSICGLFLSKNPEGKEHRLLTRIDTDKEDFPVVFDENDLYRVLYQFIRNAEKEWTTNGLDAEKDCKIDIKIEERENDVAIIIKDNVGGIDIQKLRDKLGARAYDMTDDQVADTIFERGVSTNSSGLGLSIAAKFVEENGGSIKLRPKVGEGEDPGAEFTILLKKAD